MPEILAIFPIPAVIAIPSDPPINTRRVGESSFEPAIRAETAPVMIKPTRVKRTMLQALLPSTGSKAPANGINPPNVKEIAEAAAA